MTQFPFVLAVLMAAMAPTRQVPAVEPAVVQEAGFFKRKVRAFLTDEPAGGRGFHLGPFIPRVEVVSSGGGPAGVLHFWTPDIGGTGLDIHAAASYSIYKYQHYNAEIGLVPHAGNALPRDSRGTNALFPLSDLEKTARVPGFNIYASAQYRDYPREDFFGTGPSSLRSARSDYRLKDALYEGVIRFSVSGLTVMGRAGLLQTSVHPGLDSAFPNTEAVNNDNTAPGLLRSPDFIHLSAGAWLERREEPLNAHRGFSVGIAASRFTDRDGTAFQFNRLSIDAREYLPLGSNRHVIALRQVASLDRPDAGSRVPFYLQSTLGGSLFLRGYPSSRFRDDKLLAMAAEYRFELRPKIEFALMYEAGKVFPTMSSFNLRDLERSYGLGIRLKSPRKVRLRLDVLRSSEGTRVHVKLGPSF